MGMAFAMRYLDPFQRSASALVEEAVIVQPNSNIGSQFAQNQGVIDISQGKLIADTPKPTSLNVTVASASGSGADTKTIQLFNNDFYTGLVTDNGSGADSIGYTWGDKFDGKAYQQLFSNNICNLGNGKSVMGIGIRGFTLQVTVNSTGASTAAYFNTMDMNIEMINMMGRKSPFTADLIEAIRNSQYIAGTLTVKFPYVMNGFMQVSYDQAVNTKFAWTFITEYSSNLK